MFITLRIILSAQNKADVNKTNSNGSTPIMSAACEGHLAIIEFLLPGYIVWQFNDYFQFKSTTKNGTPLSQGAEVNQMSDVWG